MLFPPDSGIFFYLDFFSFHFFLLSCFFTVFGLFVCFLLLLFLGTGERSPVEGVPPLA